MPTNEKTIEELTEAYMFFHDLKIKRDELTKLIRGAEPYFKTLARHIGQQKRQIAWKKDGSGRATPAPGIFSKK